MYFRVNDEKLYNRIVLLQELIGDQELYGEPCALLHSQLIELEVLTNKLIDLVGELKENIIDQCS